MAIDYVEIRDKDRKMIGIIDTAKSIIWKSEYYGTGDFEIYVSATPQTIPLLKTGCFVTRPNDVNIGIIEDVEISYSPQDGRMIIAQGRFAKSILDRRIIYNLSGRSITPTISYGLVEVAVRNLVQSHIISTGQTARNITFIDLGPIADIRKRIVDENGVSVRRQTSFGNLLEYTDGLLETYGLGAYMSFAQDTKNLLYNVFEGKDRRLGNSSGLKPLIFSQSYDNLLSSTYKHQTSAYKNTALIGGEGEGTNRFCVMVGVNASGMDRREVWVDAGSQSQTQNDEGTGEQSTYTDEEYAELLKTYGRQQLEQLKPVNTFDGEVDLSNSDLVFGLDYWIGDLVTMHDDGLGISSGARIISATETQDESGYNITVSFGI